jgi:hypothetical protein
VVPGLCVLCASAFCVNLLIMSPMYSGAGLGIVGLGAVVYGVWGRRDHG